MLVEQNRNDGHCRLISLASLFLSFLDTRPALFYISTIMRNIQHARTHATPEGRMAPVNNGGTTAPLVLSTRAPLTIRQRRVDA